MPSLFGKQLSVGSVHLVSWTGRELTGIHPIRWTCMRWISKFDYFRFTGEAGECGILIGSPVSSIHASVSDDESPNVGTIGLGLNK
jgi:hypothetical protein